MGLKSALQRGKARSLNFIGADALPAQSRKYIWTHINFILFSTIPGVFINTFFFRIDGKISTVAIFNAISTLGAAIVMQFSSTLSLKISPVNILRVGVGLYNIFYITLLVLQTRAVYYMILLAVLNAIAAGFYWQSYNILLRKFSDNTNLDKVISIFGMANSVFTLIIPTISGYIIARSGGILGYSIIFLLAFLSSVYTTFCSTKIESFRINAKSTLLLTYKKIFTQPRWTFSYFAEFFRGVRDTAFALFLTIIFYKYVHNEAILGINTTVCGLAGLLFFYAAGRIVRDHNRIRMFTITTLLFTVSYLVLFFRTGAWVIFLLTVLNGLYGPFIVNPSVATFYKNVSANDGRLNVSQIMAGREVFLASGRVAGLILLIIFFNNTAMLPVAVLILNLATLVTVICYRLANRRGAKCTNFPD